MAQRNLRLVAQPMPAPSAETRVEPPAWCGVVRWQGAVVPEAECVEVTGSHVGLAVNRKTYHALA